MEWRENNAEYKQTYILYLQHTVLKMMNKEMER